MNTPLIIKSAFYGKKDVKSIVEDLVIDNTSLYFISNNGIFGDPEPGTIKKLKIEYVINGREDVVEVSEEEYVKVNPCLSDRLGIWYTNNCNTKPKIIKKSLDHLYNISKSKATILTSVWEEIEGNPFMSYKSIFKHGGHVNITLQILQLLYTAQKLHDFKYVSFLEHDVLYPEGYFDYPDFDRHSVLTNKNYIQLSNKGWQENNTIDEPLHQMTMHFSDAIATFEENLKKGLRREGFLLEDQNLKRDIWNCETPAVHIFHGEHFTSHYNTYTNNFEKGNYYWGNVGLYSDLLEIT